MLIVCGASADEGDYDAIQLTYKHIAEQLGWEDGGILVVPGVYEKGTVKNTPYLAAAEDIGKNI